MSSVHTPYDIFGSCSSGKFSCKPVKDRGRKTEAGRNDGKTEAGKNWREEVCGKTEAARQMREEIRIF